jgi:hypothetical protein
MRRERLQDLLGGDRDLGRSSTQNLGRQEKAAAPVHVRGHEAALASPNHEIPFPISNTPSAVDDGWSFCKGHSSCQARGTRPTAIAFPASAMVS